MRSLQDAQYELDNNLLFVGHRADNASIIGISDLDTGTADVRDGDSEANPAADGRRFGRGYRDAPTWTFTFSVRGATPADSAQAVEDLRAAWRADSVRSRPGATSVLRYQLHGRDRRVYGRGGNFSDTLRQGLTTKVYPALGEFNLEEPLCFDDAEQQLPLDLLTHESGGITLPATFPWTWGSTSSERQGQVTVGGNAATPFRVVITGPLTGSLTSPYIKSKGWRMDFPGLTVAYDQTLEIDTRLHTAKLNGVTVAGKMSRKSSLRTRLATGTQEVVFGCTDPTNSSRATIYWRPAYAL